MKRLQMSSYNLKIIAIVAMSIDHAAILLLSLSLFSDSSPLYIILRGIGRITAPIMCFLLAEGYRHTKNVNRYALRLLAFSAISALPYSFFMGEGGYGLGMIWTLLLGLIAIRITRISFLPLIGKIAGVFALCVFSLLGDYQIVGVLFPVFFDVFRGNKRRQIAAYVCLVVCFFFLPDLMAVRRHAPVISSAVFICFGFLLPLPLFCLYDGKLGGKKGKKWFFYIYYPAHLLALGVIRTLCVN